VILPAELDSEKLADAPVPVREMLCGLPEALSVTLMLPVRVPDAVGVNVTLITQFAPAASELPQVLASAKSPVAEIPVIVSAAFPVLLNVTACLLLVELTVWFPNANDPGCRLAPGVGVVTPVPVSATVCGLPEALSAMLTIPTREPVAVGVNVTLIVHFAATANELPQVLASAKSPVAEIPVIVSAAFPVLLNVTACLLLVELTVWFPNANDPGCRLAPGVGVVTPVPVNVTLCGLLLALSWRVNAPA
jgi:hypothetical protein